MAKQIKKADLIKILVEEYGYEKEDIKLLTNAKLQSIMKQEEEDAKELEAQENIVVSKAPSIKDEDQIVIMSGSSGAFTHRGRNGLMWKFKSFGQQDKMNFGELKAIKNICPNVLEQGYIVVLNKEVQGLLGLTEIYNNIIMPNNIDEVFSKSVEELEVFVDALPQGMKITFISKARELYASRRLYDVRIIDMIEKKFGFSLADNAPLSDIV
jgi:hypothetical protein